MAVTVNFMSRVIQLEVVILSFKVLSSTFHSLRGESYRESYKKADLGFGATEKNDDVIFLNLFCH